MPIHNRYAAPARRTTSKVQGAALNNAAKYSKADTVRVAFQADAEWFKLSIADNGKGFDPNAARDTELSGNGLFNMNNRMEQMGCQCCIVSAPGMGCTVEAFGKFE